MKKTDVVAHTPVNSGAVKLESVVVAKDLSVHRVANTRVMSIEESVSSYDKDVARMLPHLR